MEERTDIVTVVTRMMICLMVFLIGALVLVECQHNAMMEQEATIKEQKLIISEQDSLIDELCEECESLQIVIGVDND